MNKIAISEILFGVTMRTSLGTIAITKFLRYEDFIKFSSHRPSHRGGRVCIYIGNPVKPSVVEDFAVITNSYDNSGLTSNKTVFRVMRRLPSSIIGNFIDLPKLYLLSSLKLVIF